MSLVLMIIFWFFFYSKMAYFKVGVGILYLFLVLCLSVFPVLGRGWASKRKYGILGALRGAAQRISYEVVLVFSLIWVFLFFKEKNFYLNKNLKLGFIFIFVLILWILVIICETNRAPFDFAEGERELVSGFNIEYGSFPFALLFLAEYGVILFLSMITGFLFFKYFLRIFIGWIIRICFIWVRRTFPRFRYDMLMVLCWGIFLPLTFFIFFFQNFILDLGNLYFFRFI